LTGVGDDGSFYNFVSIKAALKINLLLPTLSAGSRTDASGVVGDSSLLVCSDFSLGDERCPLSKSLNPDGA
jgi:hypothetical protein